MLHCPHLGWVAVVLGIVVTACKPIEPPVPTRLAFIAQPTDAVGAQPITPAVVVEVHDASGTRVSVAPVAVTLALGENPTGATLSGTLTVTATDGVATFSDLRINRPGNGYTLEARASQLDGATSRAFAVTITFISISAGREHTCGVTPGRAAYCWGSNSAGSLGTGRSSTQLGASPFPLLVEGDLGFTAVSAGAWFTCGLTGQGRAGCWGYNVYGELGDGTGRQSDVPVAVAGGLSFAAVSGRARHACGVTSEGIAYCWGENHAGELGIGTAFTGSFAPVPVSGGLRFTTVSAGSGHTCGITTGGATYCWGWNGSGQLGAGSASGPESCGLTDCSTVPVAVAGDLTLASVTAGEGYTCGLTSEGHAYCWGENREGQLGIATATGPEQCTQSSGEPVPCSTVPVAVSGGLLFTTVSAGGSHTCGLTGGGATYCWGSNHMGTLGVGTAMGPQECNAVPCSTVPVRVAGDFTFATLAAGELFHSCGLTTDGTAYCWGNNAFGRLGDGTSTDRHQPTKVAGQP